jgi:AcrR family transcriptional regulator
MHMPVTDETILEKALELFSQKGFAGTSMRDLALATGLKCSSLYSHYAGKDAIWDAIVAMMEKRYEELMSSIHVPLGMDGDAVPFYAGISEDGLVGVAKKLFLYFTYDKETSAYRRMVSLRRYENGKYASWFIDAPIQAEASLYGKLQEAGVFRKGDPLLGALSFYGPIYLLIDRYDGQESKKAEALALLEEHVRSFARAHKIVGEENEKV